MNKTKVLSRRYLDWCRLCRVEPPISEDERISLARMGRVYALDITRLWDRFICLKKGAEAVERWREADQYRMRRGSFIDRHQDAFDQWLSTLEVIP